MGKKIRLVYGVLLILSVGFLSLIYLTFHSVNYYAQRDMTTVNIEQVKIVYPNDLRTEITGRLPEEMQEDETLGFYTIHQKVKVYIGDRLIYEHGQGANLFGHTPGLVWNFVPINQKNSGSDYKIKLESVYKETAHRIPVVYLGEKNEIFNFIIQKCIFPAVICLITGVFGIVMLFYWIYMRIKADIDMSLFYLGTFSVLLALWSFNELEVASLILNNHLLIAYLSFVVLKLMLIPFVLFTKEFFTDHENLFWYIICIMSIVDIVLCMVLQAFNILDFRHTLYITHFVLAIFVIFMGYMVCKEILNRTAKREMKINMICLFIVLVGMSLDIIKYYFKVGDANLFGRICYLIYIIVLGILSMHNTVKLIERGREAEIYHRLAYIDQLTGLLNRTAFARDISSVQPEQLDKTCIFMLDLNDLKGTNDKLGHQTGDRYIIASADIIRHIFEDAGQCYRIGGDEFCVLTDGRIPIHEEEFFEKIRQETENWNKKINAVHVEIACGFAKFDAAYDQNIDDIVKRADEKMYRNKREMKGQE